MRPRARRAVAAGVIAGAVGLAIAATTPPALRALPEVRVVHVAAPATATSTVALANQTSDPITITEIARDPACDPEVTHVLATPATVPASGSLSVTVQCAGTVTAGMKRCRFHVNPAVSGPALLDFEAVCEGGGAASLAASPSTLDLGSVVVGGEVGSAVTLTNTGAPTITRLALATTDLDGTFELGAPCNPDARVCEASIASVAGSGTTPVTVWCRPKSVGTHTAELHVAANTGQYVAAPIALSCTGTAAATPALAISGDPVDAGSVEVTLGSATPTPIRLRNIGGAPLQLRDVQIVAGGNGAAADWSVVASGNCTGTLATGCELAPDEETYLQLTFDPSAIGARDATLVINYTDTAARSRSIPLDGLGIGATLAVRDAPVVLDFGTLPLNVTSDLAFSLLNHGNRELVASLSATPAGAPFALVPAATIPVPPGTPAVVAASCRPTAVGAAQTTFHAMAADAFALGDTDVVARCEGTTSTLYANPSSVVFGEVRTSTTPVLVPIQVLVASGAPLTIASATLATASSVLSVDATLPAPTPLTLQLAIAATSDGPLANELVITATNGTTVRVPITGAITTATYQEPLARSLGTFCVNQPTTAEALVFRTTGTAMIQLAEPMLALGAMSPFDLQLQAPTAYPALLAGSATAAIEVTPRRQATAGVQQDDIVWTTDVADATTTRTQISARFVDDGGAVAPDALSFGPGTIHLEQMNAQKVTLQNCDTQTIVFDDPQVPAPFRIDIGTLPHELLPNETATISIGFHPTRVGVFDDILEITSAQLEEPLRVRLTGEGARPVLPEDGGIDTPSQEEQSFYGCGGCATRSPSSAGAIVLALGLALRPRRRARSNAA